MKNSTLQRSRRRPLPPLPPEQARLLSVNEKGCVWVCLLKRQGWDCYQSMPRYSLYMLYHPRHGYGLLVYRENTWQLLIERGTGR